MPQRKQVTWSQLRVGILTMVGLFLVMVAVLYVTGAGILAPKYQLTTFLPEVESLTLGAPVRLDGVEVGNVDSIVMAPRPSTGEFNRLRNVKVVLRIDRRFRDEIRSDSRASLVTEGLLGNRYVRITRGVSGPVVQTGGEVPGEEEVAIKQITERGADLVQNLGELSREVREIVAGVKRGQGSLGLLLTDESLYNRLNTSASRLDTMLADTQAGKNSLGKFVTNDEFYQRVNSAAAKLDKLLADVQEQNGTLGKLVHDPDLYNDARDFVAKGNAFLADVRAGKGSLGKLTTDEQLYDNLRDSAASLKEVTDKLGHGQGSMSKLVNDPQLYDNLTALSHDLRLLIGDFRQNPKKYLRIKMSIF